MGERCTALLLLERKEGVRVAGTLLDATFVRIPATAPVALRVDERFVEREIVTCGRLIDLAATALRWKEPVGRRPEEFLQNAPVGALAVCPTNFGWQREAVLIDGGRLLTLAADRRRTAVLQLLGRRAGRWEASEIDLREGAPARAVDRHLIESLELGFEAPWIIRNGALLPRRKWITHPRLLADLRNAFDFALGRGSELAPELWVELRKALPQSAASALALERGEGCRERCALSDPEHLERLLAEAGLAHISLTRVSRGSAVEVEVRGPLPATRLPLLGIGVTADGALDLTAIDGRRRDCPGGTIEELARLMLERGVVDAILGSAGGDVAIVERSSEGCVLRNIPSNIDPGTGHPVTRRVPALLVAG